MVRVNLTEKEGVYVLIKNNPIMRFVGWYFFANTIIVWIVGLQYLNVILASSSLFQNSMVDFSGIIGKSLVTFFAIVNYLSYMMLLVYIAAFPLLVLAWIAPLKRIIFLLSILITVLGLMLLIIDIHTYSMFKFHLNTTLLSFVFSSHYQQIFNLSQHELTHLLEMIIVIFVIELSLAWVIWKKIILEARFKIGTMISALWIGGLLFSYFTLMLSISCGNNIFAQQIPNIPLYEQLYQYISPFQRADDRLYRYSEHHFSQPIFSKDKLYYPLHPMQCKAPVQPYNIILIMVDSLRADSLDPRYMPNTLNFSKKSWRFQAHLSGGNATQPGLFSLFYSIPSSYWTAALNQAKEPVFMAILAKYGYSRHVFWSSEMQTPPFDRTIYVGLDELSVKGAPRSDEANRDRYITEKALALLESGPHKHPFFLNLFYNTPHAYRMDNQYPEPFQPILINYRVGMPTNDMEPTPFYNRYLNAVTFIDNEVEKILNVIEKKGYLDNSIVIITSDHGQEFNDNRKNYWEHASNYTKFQIQVPLIIHWPNEAPRNINYLTSAYDLVPTILERLFLCENAISDYSVGQSLLSEKNRLPFILAGSYVNMGLIEPDRLTTLEASGRISITDIHASPLPDEKPRIDNIKQALALMRRYFNHEQDASH